MTNGERILPELTAAGRPGEAGPRPTGPGGVTRPDAAGDHTEVNVPVAGSQSLVSRSRLPKYQSQPPPPRSVLPPPLPDTVVASRGGTPTPCVRLKTRVPQSSSVRVHSAMMARRAARSVS